MDDHDNKMGITPARRRDTSARARYLDDDELEDGEWPSGGGEDSARKLFGRKKSLQHQQRAKQPTIWGKKKASTEKGLPRENPNLVPLASKGHNGHNNYKNNAQGPKALRRRPQDRSPPRLSFFTTSPTPGHPPPTKRPRDGGERKAPTEKGKLRENPNLVPLASKRYGSYTNNDNNGERSKSLRRTPPQSSSLITMDIKTMQSQLESLKQNLEHHQEARKEWDDRQHALTEEIVLLGKSVHDYRTLYYKADEFGKRTFAELLHYKAWIKEKGLKVPEFEPTIENVNAYIISERDKIDFQTALQIYRVENALL